MYYIKSRSLIRKKMAKDLKESSTEDNKCWCIDRNTLIFTVTGQMQVVSTEHVNAHHSGQGESSDGEEGP